jgi:hypothetical protein
VFGQLVSSRAAVSHGTAAAGGRRGQNIPSCCADVVYLTIRSDAGLSEYVLWLGNLQVTPVYACGLKLLVYEALRVV